MSPPDIQCNHNITQHGRMVNNVLYQLSNRIKTWGKELGFADVGITGIDLSAYEPAFLDWLAKGFQGEMDYMGAHGTKRSRPTELEPETLSIISVRMNYFDGDAHSPIEELQRSDRAYISRYALHKDYHKLVRKRLQQLAERINEFLSQENYFASTPLNTHHNSEIPLADKHDKHAKQSGARAFKFRAFCDSAPVLERPLAQEAGLGFIGKNSLLIHPRAGSWFFLGELYCNLPLPTDPPFEKQGCGPCTACLDECPTGAIVDNGVVDARKCISYLTIEHPGTIDPELRPKIGNRIYGCDDCQLVCPWNHFTELTQEASFKAKNHSPTLDSLSLRTLLKWTETEFLQKMEGSPIRRIGFRRWQRNLCIAIGNDAFRPENINALTALIPADDMVAEHREWALAAQHNKASQSKEALSEALSESTPRSGTPAVAPKYYLPTKKRPRSTR